MNSGPSASQIAVVVGASGGIGPAPVAKHFLPLLPRHGRSVFAALSAPAGSIADNRLTGWYAWPADAAARLLGTIHRLPPEASGGVFAWHAARLPA